MLHWIYLPPARANGLSRSSGQPDRMTMTIAALIVLPPMTLLMLWSTGGLSFGLSMFSSLLIVWVFTMFCRQQIDGQTGDTIGASQQLTELAFVSGTLISISP